MPWSGVTIPIDANTKKYLHSKFFSMIYLCGPFWMAVFSGPMAGHTSNTFHQHPHIVVVVATATPAISSVSINWSMYLNPLKELPACDSNGRIQKWSMIVSSRSRFLNSCCNVLKGTRQSPLMSPQPCCPPLPLELVMQAFQLLAYSLPRLIIAPWGRFPAGCQQQIFLMHLWSPKQPLTQLSYMVYFVHWTCPLGLSHLHLCLFLSIAPNANPP